MRILYCRIGWMKSYSGNSIEKPEGGGKYNRENTGHEVYNFLREDNKYYGYVESGKSKNIRIEKLCNDKKAESVDDVLVVWVATKPKKGRQYIVGWYQKATVYRELQIVPDTVMTNRELKDHNDYNICSESKYVVLVDHDKRNYAVKGMGHCNIWYGDSKIDSDVEKYISQYESDCDERIEKIEKNLDEFEGKERESLVKQRVNQDKFRKILIDRYKSCCLCGVTYESLLVASHIKPWSKSDSHEKLDSGNGLLLCPNHDKLFDAGLISFADNGQILISEKLDEANRVYMNISDDMKVKVEDDNLVYIKYHRTNIFS